MKGVFLCNMEQVRPGTIPVQVPYLCHQFRVCGRRRRSDDTPPEDQNTHTSNQTTNTFSTRAVLQGSASWCLWFPPNQHGLQMGLFGRDHGISCVRRDMWQPPATTPLSGIKPPLTTSLFTTLPAPTHAHEKPPTSQPLMAVLHWEELEGADYQSDIRAGVLGNEPGRD